MISIVLPVYNAQEYIRKCIDSILKQSYPDWELIIVDNGSEDDSFQICHEYAKEEERIFVLHQYRNQGVSAARNLALEKATGDYITFLDADDWVADDYLEQLLKKAEGSKADMVVCGYRNVLLSEREGDTLQYQEKKEQEHSSKIYHRKEDYFIECFLNGYTHCWGVLYKRSLLDGIHFPTKITIGEDVLFLLDTIMQAEIIEVTDYDGYYYYINEQGAMNRKFTVSYMDQILCWKKAKERLIDNYPSLEDKLDSILIVSAMLVVGKLSALSKEELNTFQKEMEECKEIVQKYCRRKVYRLLPAGYGVKVTIFKLSSSLYLRLYGRWKNKK